MPKHVWWDWHMYLQWDLYFRTWHQPVVHAIHALFFSAEPAAALGSLKVVVIAALHSKADTTSCVDAAITTTLGLFFSRSFGVVRWWYQDVNGAPVAALLFGNHLVGFNLLDVLNPNISKLQTMQCTLR